LSAVKKVLVAGLAAGRLARSARRTERQGQTESPSGRAYPAVRSLGHPAIHALL
jgi:hypothetical protein